LAGFLFAVRAILSGSLKFRPGHLLCVFAGLSLATNFIGSIYIGLPLGTRQSDLVAMNMSSDELFAVVRKFADVGLLSTALYFVCHFIGFLKFRGAWRFGFFFLIANSVVTFYFFLRMRALIVDLAIGDPEAVAFFKLAEFFDLFAQLSTVVVLILCCTWERFRGDVLHLFGVATLVTVIAGTKLLTYLVTL
jgi:hypothetical protein